MELFYREFGEPADKPLIILHGLFGMSDNWMSIARQLSEQGRYVLLPDQRNHGRSGHSSVFNYTSMVDDLLEFMDAREVEKSCLLGHSMGGKTAMQFSLDYPDRTEKLIVADMSPGRSSHGSAHTSIIDALLEVGVENYSSRKELTRDLAGVITNKKLRMFLQKNLYRKDKSGLGWRINLEAIRENLDEVFSPVNSNATFEKDVLFIRGGISDYLPIEDFDLIKKIFPSAEIKTIDGASHWLHADRPEEFIKEVKTFLAK